MQCTIVVCLVFVACACAQVSLPPGYEQKYPEYVKFSKQARHPRDVTWDTKAGGGKVFGTLGNDDSGLFGKGGYKQDIFNDARGKLEGQAYGKRVLGPMGDSSHLGGRLDWSNEHAKAALDISKQIGGKTNVEATGAGQWKLDKNTRFSAGGSVSQQSGGKPDVAVKAQITHDF